MKIKLSKPSKLFLITCFLYAAFSVIFDHAGISIALGNGYGHGYGYGNSVDLSYKGHDVKSRKTSKGSVKLCFSEDSQVAYYLLSKNSNFSGATWKSMPSNGCVKLKISRDFNNKKTRYYIRFKDDYGAVSKIFTKTLIYKKPSNAQLRVSKKNVNIGENLIFRGRKFSKNNIVNVYFSNQNGLYGSPVKIGTDQFGNLKFDRNIGQVKGTFSWYAVDMKTGKISKKVYFYVK